RYWQEQCRVGAFLYAGAGFVRQLPTSFRPAKEEVMGICINRRKGYVERYSIKWTKTPTGFETSAKLSPTDLFMSEIVITFIS
ncbi:hypothetical protein, partial [Segatella buccae]